MGHFDSKWPAIETAEAIKPEDMSYLCELFNKSDWKNLKETGFF